MKIRTSSASRSFSLLCFCLVGEWARRGSDAYRVQYGSDVYKEVDEETCQADPEDEDEWWQELSEEKRDQYKRVGWTERMWNSEDIDEPYFFQDWSEMTETTREAVRALGWTEELWTDHEPNFNTPAEKTPWNRLTPLQKDAAEILGYDEECWLANDWGTDFDPIMVKFSIPELERLDLDYLETLDDVEVELMDGHTLGDDVFTQNRGFFMNDFIAAMRNGSTHLYLKYEDYDPFKVAIRNKVGSNVLDHLGNALRNSVLSDRGYFKPEFDTYALDDHNWLIWVGGKGTFTPVHTDDDLFNFIWVVEGRKRVVMIPNDDRTVDLFNCGTEIDGHSCWPGVDVLGVEGGDRPLPLHYHAVDVEIGPGEGLMIPHLCWHAVENLEPTLAYGFRVDPEFSVSDAKSWTKMTYTERNAAEYLGYNEHNWSEGKQ